MTYNTKGPIPVIAQDVRTNNVLMLAWADAEALRRTKKTGFMHYWSRSRGKYWKKGEESGHFQKLVQLLHDCDRDTILARVEQTGPACHKGTYSCFARRTFRAGALEDLRTVFEDRRRRPKKGSWTNALLADPRRLQDKVLEEAMELVMAARGRRRKEIVSEAADLLYHTLLLLFANGVTLEEVEGELEARRRAPSRLR